MLKLIKNYANLSSYVEYDCVIGDYVTFAPAVKVLVQNLFELDSSVTIK